MNTPTARLNYRRRPGFAEIESLRFRAELPVVSAPPRTASIATAGHDFLVPNPRPDLTTDPQIVHQRPLGF